MNFNYGFILESTAKKIKLELQRKFNELGIDITVDQWVVMHELHVHGTQNQVSLCEHCAKDAPTITRIIELLLKKEIVNRDACSEDRRRFNISLSKKGKVLVLKLLPLVIEFRKQGWKNLTDKDISHLERITKKIQENL
ncbi:MAG TPA: MarR family transcriptional regulator [Chitinophagales bacterium]|jgi:DNA-binding MarR family transcriptional regulator|nr:MarR family transcriptional regulator [Chitinophagales bacterium]MBP6154804.1 MarR family transcriptional regulator [Chitinophagales bacterium]HQV76868.1 MarR family transcriptional regulator [Chitinophagales bacterium]HQW78065.1 MarR family transcriptional regulator [Chitinophagales bacterium]HRB18781.1 MarR family transcriptional regulator [Chitinophagales bacterium]